MREIIEDQPLRGRRADTAWFYKIHRRMIKPPFPVLLRCPNCGGPLIEVNANMIEISNDPGMPVSQLTAKDVWSKLKHQRCGAKITFYWKD